jgi:hypothetical protein
MAVGRSANVNDADVFHSLPFLYRRCSFTLRIVRLPPCYPVPVEDLRIISKLKRGPKPEIVAYMEGKELRRLMRKHRVTIRELAQRMQITQKRIRERREEGRAV